MYFTQLVWTSPNSSHDLHLVTAKMFKYWSEMVYHYFYVTIGGRFISFRFLQTIVSLFAVVAILKLTAITTLHYLAGIYHLFVNHKDKGVEKQFM